jgi:molecular chaperone DnaJ
MENYYKTLGLNRDASDEEIKTAYRKLAHKYHPDKSGGDEQKFKKINEAYQVLSNKEKRRQYDQFGQVFETGAGQAGGNPFQGFNWNVDFNGADFGDLGGIGDIFETFFGGRQAGGRARARGADLEMMKEISLEEAAFGKKIELDFETKVECEKCGGKGYDVSKGVTKCAACGGSGRVKNIKNTILGSFYQESVCPECKGKGEIPKELCGVCRGKGVSSGKRKIVFDIKPGVENGQIIKINNKGEALADAPAGDLYVRIKVKPHPIFERSGNNLIMKKQVGLKDILLGKKIEITTLSGKKIEVAIPAGFNLREDLRVAGEGINRQGDLYIRLDVKTPKKISPTLKKSLEESDGEW